MKTNYHYGILNRTLVMYHLNKNDYREIKEYAGNSTYAQ